MNAKEFKEFRDYARKIYKGEYATGGLDWFSKLAVSELTTMRKEKEELCRKVKLLEAKLGVSIHDSNGKSGA